MADLIRETHTATVLPLTVGGATLAVCDFGPVTTIQPFRARTGDVAAILDAPFPGRGEVYPCGAARLIWVAPGRALLAGALPPDGLAGLAALTDQTDAQAVVALSGPAALDVLARLVPLDLAAMPFPSTARTLLGHMTAGLVRTAPDRFEIMVFRSMAGTLLHDIERAMRHVAARG